MTSQTSELAQKNRQLSALHEISRAIARAQNLDDTLELITRRTTEVMQVDSCSIYLYNHNRQQLTLAATTGLNKSEVGRVSLPDGTGLTGWAAAQRQTVAVRDAFADVRFVRVPGSGESKFPSLLAMPLVSHDQVIGAANVQTIEQHTFAPAEQELFSLITELAAIALDKAQRVHSALVQEMHHRVKNNLQTIAMLLRMQLADSAGLSPHEALTEAINRVLSIAAVHEILSETGVDEVSALSLIRRVTDSVSATMVNPAAHITLTVSGDDILLPTRQATGLALIANELAQNALEHGLTGRDEGHIAISLIHRDRQLRLRVEDNGRGLPPGFNPDTDLGLGLEIVRATATEDMNGKFFIGPNRRGSGTHTQITLPVSF